MGRAGDMAMDGMPQADPTFADVQWQTAAEKERVFKAWKRFLDSGFDEAKFSKALYDHLMQHSGFIAHFNRQGFYAAQFGSPSLRASFIERYLSGGQLESYRAGGPDYEDINNAMAEALRARQNELLYAANRERVDELLGMRERINAELNSYGVE